MKFDSTTATEVQLNAMQALADLRASWGEPDWSMLDDRRGALPEFPENVLAPKVREYVSRAARGAGVTFSHVAVPLLAIASAIIGTSRRVQASRSFTQPMTFWAAVVGFSGSGKTPGISVTLRALAEIERLNKDRVAELQRQHETKVEAAKAATKQWQTAVAEAIEAGQPAPPKPASVTNPGPFVRPRLCVSDVTIERVAVLIQARPSGLAVVVDELAGLFANMNRYSHGSDREFWLESCNANPYTVERMGRDPITLDRLLVGVMGGFQPDKLAAAFDGDHDGMSARVCFAWPSECGYRPLTDDVAEIEPEIINALIRLSRLGEPDSEGVFVSRAIPLSAAAMVEFESFRQFLHLSRDSSEGREAEWWNKGAASVLRFAGTLAMLDWAWTGDGPEPDEIGAAHIGAAVSLWRDYFWLHSCAALRQIGSSRRQSKARRVLLWLQKENKARVAVQDIRRDLFHNAIDAREAETILDGLTAGNWLRKEDQEKKGPGRRAHRWAVNPSLHVRGLNAEIAGIAETPTAGHANGISVISAISATGNDPDPDGWTFQLEADSAPRGRA